MNFFRQAYHFLGSVSFAIILIATVTIFVIIGTFLESATESHRFAAAFTYSHPVFILMLWLFFVNILLSALRRWPFKLHHIPFLITHFGLLMILAGVLAKSYWGTQGTMGILEGSASQQIFIPGTHVVRIENRKGIKDFSLEELQQKITPFPGLQIALAEYIPHVKEQYEMWIKGKQAFLLGASPLPVYEEKDLKDSTLLPISGQGKFDSNQTWDVMAFRTSDVAGLAQKAYLQGLILQLTDQKTQEILLEVPVTAILKQPFNFSKGTISAKLESSSVSSPVPEFPSSLVVNLELRTQDSGLSNHSVLSTQYSVLLTQDSGTRELGNSLRSQDLVALKRPATLVLIQDQQGSDFLFAFDPNGAVRCEVFHPDDLSSFIVYDHGYGGYTLPASFSFPSGNLQIECPLTVCHDPLPVGNKWEDHLPQITLQLVNHGKVERISLAYDRYGTGLKWPVGNGEYLIRFQPQFQSLPYRVRLRDARQINYPNSSQSFSYESDVVITDLSDHSSIETTLSMNHVHETWDGYRFYLANIQPTEEIAPQRIQLIVNHDPAKYLLTYPGGIIVSIGILLLFWKKKY